MSKKKFKNNSAHIFVTEGLTREKKTNKIHSFWTFDGRVFTKKKSGSDTTLINSFQDVEDL